LLFVEELCVLAQNVREHSVLEGEAEVVVDVHLEYATYDTNQFLHCKEQHRLEYPVRQQLAVVRLHRVVCNLCKSDSTEEYKIKEPWRKIRSRNRGGI
jgi:hypothetical protein